MHFFFAVVYKRIFEISGQENNNDDWNFILDQNLVNEWNLQISEIWDIKFNNLVTIPVKPSCVFTVIFNEIWERSATYVVVYFVFNE